MGLKVKSGQGNTTLLAPLLGRANLRRIHAGIVLSVLAQVTLAAIPLIQQRIVDDCIVAGRQSLGTWITILLVVGVVCLGQYLRRSVGRAAARGSVTARTRPPAHAAPRDASARGRFRTGDVMSRATSDLTLIQMFLQQLGLLAGNITLLASAPAVMLYLSPLLSLVMVIAVPAFPWVAARFRPGPSPPATPMPYKGRGGRGRRGDHRVRVVKAFGQEAQGNRTL